MNVYLISAALPIYGCENSVRTLTSLLQAYYHIPDTNMKSLFGGDTTTTAFLANMQWLNTSLKNEACVGIMLYSGHGTNVAMSEMYCLPDGTITADQMTGVFDDMHPSSLLLVVSECCDSANDMDTMYDNKPFAGNFVTIGATQHYQDDQCSDIGPLTEAIAATFPSLTNQTTAEIAQTLTTYMHNSWVGDMQTPTITPSSDKLLSVKPFRWDEISVMRYRV